MPLYEDEFQQGGYLVLTASATVAEATARLRDAGGNEWWYLLVDEGSGTYAILDHPDGPSGTFDDLRKAVEAAQDRAAFFARTLGELDLMPVEIVDQAGTESYAAEEMLDESEAGVLVVLRQGEVAGLMTLGGMRADSGAVFTPLVEMYEQTVGDAIFSSDDEGDTGG